MRWPWQRRPESAAADVGPDTPAPTGPVHRAGSGEWRRVAPPALAVQRSHAAIDIRPQSWLGAHRSPLTLQPLVHGVVPEQGGTVTGRADTTVPTPPPTRQWARPELPEPRIAAASPPLPPKPAVQRAVAPRPVPVIDMPVVARTPSSPSSAAPPASPVPAPAPTPVVVDVPPSPRSVGAVVARAPSSPAPPAPAAPRRAPDRSSDPPARPPTADPDPVVAGAPDPAPAVDPTSVDPTPSIESAPAADPPPDAVPVAPTLGTGNRAEPPHDADPAEGHAAGDGAPTPGPGSTTGPGPAALQRRIDPTSPSRGADTSRSAPPASAPAVAPETPTDVPAGLADAAAAPTDVDSAPAVDVPVVERSAHADREWDLPAPTLGLGEPIVQPFDGPDADADEPAPSPSLPPPPPTLSQSDVDAADHHGPATGAPAVTTPAPPSQVAGRDAGAVAPTLGAPANATGAGAPTHGTPTTPDVQRRVRPSSTASSAAPRPTGPASSPGPGLGAPLVDGSLQRAANPPIVTAAALAPGHRGAAGSAALSGPQQPVVGRETTFEPSAPQQDDVQPASVGLLGARGPLLQRDLEAPTGPTAPTASRTASSVARPTGAANATAASPTTLLRSEATARATVLVPTSVSLDGRVARSGRRTTPPPAAATVPTLARRPIEAAPSWSPSRVGSVAAPSAGSTTTVVQPSLAPARPASMAAAVRPGAASAPAPLLPRPGPAAVVQRAAAPPEPPAELPSDDAVLDRISDAIEQMPDAPAVERLRTLVMPAPADGDGSGEDATTGERSVAAPAAAGAGPTAGTAATGAGDVGRPGEAGGAGGGEAGSAEDEANIAELADKLYGRIRWQLRHELLLDRERSGSLIDRTW